MGGQYQPVGQCHLLQNIFDFNMSIQDSIDFPRAFNLEGKYILERSISKKIKNCLSNIGHKVTYSDETHGGAQAIFIDRSRGVMIGGSDPRKDGSAIGY